MSNPDLLPDMLEVAVPLYVMQLRGIDDPEQRFAVIKVWAEKAQDVLAEVGEGVLFRTRPGDSARGFNAVAKAIAALSFMPGGVTIFGKHWDSAGQS